MGYFRPLSQTKFINDANLVSYWKLDGNSTDSKGSNNGTDSNMSYSAGQFDSAGVFNGSSSYINVGSGASLQLGSNPFTVSMWIKKALNGTVETLYHDNSTSNPYFSFGSYSDNKLFFYAVNSGGTNQIFYSSITITDTNWHHAVITAESSSSRKIYIDGVISGTGTTNITGSISSVNAKNIGRNTNNTEYFNGSIDDTAIFSRALSAGEVAELYYSQSGDNFLQMF